MSYYYDRYQRGEHIEVWSDLIALGEAVRQEPVYSDAVAVASETMTRPPKCGDADHAFGRHRL